MVITIPFIKIKLSYFLEYGCFFVESSTLELGLVHCMSKLTHHGHIHGGILLLNNLAYDIESSVQWHSHFATIKPSNVVKRPYCILTI
jgi:hypothetical protein